MRVLTLSHRGTCTCTCINLVLQAESVDVEAERMVYEFPLAGEVVGLDTANGSEATISIPQELLIARANGIETVVCFMLFQLSHYYCYNQVTAE